MTKQFLVFTDLDGTLLNHHDYRFDEALPALRALAEKHIPVICNTSKTAAELKAIRAEIHNTAPFICENGAAIYLPKASFDAFDESLEDCGEYWRKSFVETRSYWQQLIAGAPAEFSTHFTSFAHLGIEGIVEATGLSPEQADLANQRQFNEPLLWHGDEALKSGFIDYMESQGAHMLQGGRFLHVGGQCDKATAMHWLCAVYQAKTDLVTLSIALGDSGNDIAMLNAADFAVVVKSPKQDYPTISRNHATYFTQTEAPMGWQEGINAALSHY